MGQVKKINTKNQTYCFFNDIINIEEFDSNLLKIEKIWTKTLVFTILDTLQLKKISDYENIYISNPLYLIIGEVIGHVEEKMGVNI